MCHIFSILKIGLRCFWLCMSVVRSYNNESKHRQAKISGVWKKKQLAIIAKYLQFLALFKHTLKHYTRLGDNESKDFTPIVLYIYKKQSIHLYESRHHIIDDCHIITSQILRNLKLHLLARSRRVLHFTLSKSGMRLFWIFNIYLFN